MCSSCSSVLWLQNDLGPLTRVLQRHLGNNGWSSRAFTDARQRKGTPWPTFCRCTVKDLCDAPCPYSLHLMLGDLPLLLCWKESLLRIKTLTILVIENGCNDKSYDTYLQRPSYKVFSLATTVEKIILNVLRLCFILNLTCM